MSISLPQLIAELNRDLELEYAAAVQYVHHSSMITGAQYEGIKKEMVLHVQEEMQHALILSEQITFFGGVPTTDIAPRNCSDDTRTMLLQDLAGEDEAIIRYKERIRQAEELREYGLRRVLEDILIQEEEHKRDIQSALG